MKTLGLIGGMSWNSTELYYRLINQAVAKQMGGLHSAKLFLYSFDFAEIAELQKAEDWFGAAKLMDEAAVKLKLAGAEAFVICTNTMHRMAPDIEMATGLPVLHIGDAIAEALRALKINKAGILGTNFTMSASFYSDYFRERHGIELIAPDTPAKLEIHRIIYEELCRGETRESSRNLYLGFIRDLEAKGAEAVMLACTEIGMLLKQSDYPNLPMLDSTSIHAEYAAKYAMTL